MKKEIVCNECDKVSELKYFCDTCGIELSPGTPITIDFGYGSNLDGESYHFCTYGHTIRFLTDELRKQIKGEENDSTT